jgi:hypothetical protein
MSILYLPTEVLRLVLEGTVESWPSYINVADYSKRNRILRSLALVHPTWTPIAQELLQEHVLLVVDQGTTIDSSWEIEMLCESWSPGATKTRQLTIESLVPDWRGDPGMDPWVGVRVSVDSPVTLYEGPYEIEPCGQFRREFNRNLSRSILVLVLILFRAD